MLPKVSIIVSVKNEEKYIADLLDSIASLNYPKDKLETIVIDGGSTDKTVDIISQYDFVKLITSNCNLSVAKNIGIEEATGEIIAFTDGDCVVEKNWLKNIVKYFQTNPEIVAVGGPYINSKQKELFARYLAAWAEAWFPRKTGFITHAGALGGGNVAYRRKIFEEVGLFNESLGRGSSIGSGEDVDLNLRIMNAGYKLFYAEDVKVYHKFRTAFADCSKVAFKGGMASARYYRKYKQGSTITRLRNLLIPFLFPTMGFIFLFSVLSKMFLITYTMLIFFFCYYMYKLIRFHIRIRTKMSITMKIVVPIIDIYMILLASFGSIVGLLT